MSIGKLRVPSGNCGSSCAGITVSGRDVFSMNDEIWKPVPGYVDVYASSLGRIKRRDGRTKQWLEGFGGDDGQGYFKISIHGKMTRVHRLVVAAFHENPNRLPETNHKNGIKSDNRPENLEWCDCAHNALHACRTGLRPTGFGEESRHHKLTTNQVSDILLSSIVKGEDLGVIAERHGVSRQQVKNIQLRRQWSHVPIPSHEPS